MVAKKFKSVKIGSIFFEWSEIRQSWDKFQKISFNEAVRLNPKLDVKLPFDQDAICSFHEKGD